MNTPRLRHFLPCLLASVVGLASAPAAAQQVREEVPFITSPDNVTLEMLRIANVGPPDHVIDLGSGDGRIVILAARRFGATGLGVEIVPDLVKQSNRSAQDAGVADKVTFREQDLFTTDLSRATVITMYLLQEVNMELRPRILQLKPGTRIVSHDWDMGDWQPDQTVVVPVPDKLVGLEKFSRVHLWVVPARVEGLWCGTGSARGAQLHVAQRHQMFAANLTSGPVTRALAGMIQGAELRGTDGGRITLEATDQLRVTVAAAQGPVAGTTFSRASGNFCRG